MNIYKYIRSKDVREYNEKIGHKFTATESAFLVWRNSDITLKEKHDAWQEIMREMPDEEVPERLELDYVPSLFALLRKFIEADNVLLEQFYKSGYDNPAVYSFRSCYKGDSSFCQDGDEGFRDFEQMRESVECVITPDAYVEYTKEYYDYDSPYGNGITLVTHVTDGKEEVVSVGCSDPRIDLDFRKDDFFRGLWIDVPTPFKCGDILCSRARPFGNDVYLDGWPFVLLSLTNWSYDTAEDRGEKLNKNGKARRDNLLKYYREKGNMSSMTLDAYFLSLNDHNRFTGGFYSGLAENDYVSLEYYRGEFNGGERVLLPVKYYLNGEINEAQFVKACEVVKKQEELKEEIRYLPVSDELKEKIGITKK